MAEQGRAGRILDIVEPGRERVELAWVREEAKGKARLHTSGGREHALSSKALDEAVLVDHGPAGADPLGALARRAAEIEAQRETVSPEDIDLLWQAVAGDDDDRRTLQQLAQDLFGKDAPAARRSVLARALEAEGERFTLWSRGARFTVFGRSTREARTRRAADAARCAGEAERRTAELAARVAATVTVLRPLLAATGTPPDWPAELDPFLERLLESSRLDRHIDEARPDADDARHAHAVAAELEGSSEGWTVRALAERLLRLKHPGASRTCRTRLLLGLDTVFPPVVEEAAGSTVDALASFERLDLTGLPASAIDDPWTRLRDDALSVVETDGALDVFVHIADAASRVSRGGELDRAAMHRGTAHYWPDGILPMLPPSLAEALLSFDADGRPRDAFTARFRCEHDEGGPSLRLLRLAASRIRVTANLTYDETDEALARPTTAEQRLLARLWQHLAEVRRRRIPEEQPVRREARLVVQGDGETIELCEVATGTPARRVVEELALATGMATARWALERHVPLVYRVQDAPVGGRRPVRATYTLTPDEHHAMGGALYAHVTSPLRRYVDLLNQRQILARLCGGAIEADPQVELQRMMLGVRDVLDRARDLEREAHRYWALRWLALRAGEVFDAELRLDPQVLDGSRPPRVLVLPASVLLPIDGAAGLLDRAGAGPHAAQAPLPEGAVLAVRVQVEVGDPEALAARAVLVAPATS